MAHEAFPSPRPAQKLPKRNAVTLMRTNSERVIHPGEFVYYSSPMRFFESLNLHRYSNAIDTIKYLG
eukprot:755545-Hanusia_phi.AAC.1